MSALTTTRCELLSLWRNASLRGGLIFFAVTVSAIGLWLYSSFLPRAAVVGVAAARADPAGLRLGQALVCALWIAWITGFSMYRERDVELVQRSVTSGLSATRLVLAKVAALLVVAGMLLYLTLPVVATARAVGLVSPSEISESFPRLAALLATVVLLAVHLNLRGDSRSARLALSLTAAVGLAFAFHLLPPRFGRAGTDIALGSLLGVAAVALWIRCRVGLLHLPPEARS